MALVKVTAFKWVTVIDPYPLEGVGHVTVQMEPGQYKAFHMYDNQADRMIQPLDASKAAGMLDYEIVWDDCCGINNKLHAPFSFVDVVPGNSILLGIAPAGVAVPETTIKITAEFDGGTEISVGDAGAYARLMNKKNNKPHKLGQYKTDNDYLYVAETPIYVYFISGNPTQGAGEVFVYLS